MFLEFSESSSSTSSCLSLPCHPWHAEMLLEFSESSSSTSSCLALACHRPYVEMPPSPSFTRLFNFFLDAQSNPHLSQIFWPHFTIARFHIAGLHQT